MKEYGILAALVYVTGTEHEAVQHMYPWKELRFEDDDQLYYEYSFIKDGTEKKLVAARTDEMGMTAAATMTMKLIERFRPRYVIMPGIAAGTRENESDQDGQMYGDVMLASKIWNYSNGKYVSADEAEIVFGEIGFIPRPTFIEMDSSLVQVFKKAIASEKNECHVMLGTMASGSSVVANRSLLEKYISSGYHDTIGLEMEGYGVAYAAKHASQPRPLAIVAKSVCDFADSRKSDRYQKFAAYTSCEFVHFLIENILEA